VNNPPAARAPIVDADAIEFEPALDAADSDFRELDALFAAMPPQTPAATVPETVPAMAAPAIAAPALAASAPAVVEADVPAAPSEVEAPVAAAAAVPGPQKPRARKTPARRPQKRPRRESEEDPELAGFFAALRGLPVAPTDPQ
jgi:hypothetical protein